MPARRVSLGKSETPANWGKKGCCMDFAKGRYNREWVHGKAAIRLCAATRWTMEVYLGTSSNRADCIGQGAFPLGRQHGGMPYGVRIGLKVHHQLTYAYGQIEGMKRFPIETSSRGWGIIPCSGG